MKTIYSFLFILLIYNKLYSQKWEYIKELYKYPENCYIHSMTQSNNGNYIGYSAGSHKSIVLNKDFQLEKEFTYDIMWGGGNIVFSNDESYVAYFRYEDTDSLIIYNFKNSQLIKIPTDISSMTLIKKTNQILFSWNGQFSIYDFKTNKVTKNIINVGGRENEFSSSYAIDTIANQLYVTTNKNKIDVYDLNNYKLVKSIISHNEEINNLRFIQHHLVYNINNTIHIIDLNTNVKTKVNIKAEYISDLVWDDYLKEIIIITKDNCVKSLNIFTLKQTMVIEKIHNYIYTSSYLRVDENNILIGNHHILQLYQIKN